MKENKTIKCKNKECTDKTGLCKSSLCTPEYERQILSLESQLAENERIGDNICMDWNDKVEALEKQLAEKEREIERMKSCMNCARYDRNYKEGNTTCDVLMYCTDKHEKWEAIKTGN